MASDTYDQNGNMAAIPRPGTAIPSWANLTADQWATLTADEWAKMEVAPTFRATYDAWDGLVRLTEPEASAPGVPVQDNSYDARGYRIITNTYTAGTLTETRHAYFTDQWQCLEERLGTSTTSDRQFIWGVSYIDDLILRDRSVSGGTLNERLYALQDANWNVTDSTGTIKERYEYEPYGATTVLAPDFTVRTTSNFDWETTYCSYRHDSTTGLCLARFRYYHPALGSWLTRDPLDVESDSTNLYEYVQSNPLIACDPSGLIGAGNGVYLPGITPGPPGPQYVNINPRNDRAGQLEGLAAHLKRACCDRMCCKSKRTCYEKADQIETDLIRTRNRLNATGGVTKFEYAGNVCTDCQQAVGRDLSWLDSRNQQQHFDNREVGIVPFISVPLWGGHSWSEIVCIDSGQVIATVDFWARAGRESSNAWRPGQDGFGYKPNVRRP